MTKKLLTLKKLIRTPSRGVLAHGIGTAINSMFNRDGKSKWVAVKSRSGMQDWSIYFGPVSDTFEHIMDFGSKVYDGKIIKKLVPCDDEVFERYRY